MKKFSIFILAFAMMSCELAYYKRGNGKMITRDFDVRSFSEVELRGDYEITLIESDKERLEIEADENLMDDIEVEVIGDVLRIESRKIRSRKGIRINIFYNELSGLYAGGAIELRSRNPLRSRYFDLNLAGAGEIILEFEGEKLNLRLSGAGNVELSGTTRDLEVTMSGAGGLDAFDLKAEYARIRISGIGGADIYVTKELDAKISGLGDVTYRGNPTNIDKSVSGLGTIQQDRHVSDDQ
jgi:hypothetical protein